MKKLQLLALTMLLSTPVAITYTSADAPASTSPAEKGDRNNDRQGNRDSKQDDRQARRQERLDGWKDIKSSLQSLCDSDDAVEAKKASMQATMIEQYQTLQAKNIDQLPKGDHKANLSDELAMLRSRLEDRRDCLNDRVSMIQSWVDKKSKKIATEQTSFDAKKDELNKLETAGVTSGSRVANLQDQATDLKNCIADKKAAVVKLQHKIDVANASLKTLKDRKTILAI